MQLRDPGADIRAVDLGLGPIEDKDAIAGAVGADE